jgi:hypothetical protein
MGGKRRFTIDRVEFAGYSLDAPGAAHMDFRESLRGRSAAEAFADLRLIGRNRDDKASEANTVYLVGSDRISTELHVLNRTANAVLPKPLALNYEFNDPSDLEQLYGTGGRRRRRAVRPPGACTATSPISRRPSRAASQATT